MEDLVTAKSSVTISFEFVVIIIIMANVFDFQSVFFQSVFIQSVFLQSVPRLRIFYALRVYFAPTETKFSLSKGC